MRVASGEELRCEEVIREVEVHVQGVPLIVDCYVLQLPCLDVVLGVAWLKSIGRVQMDYARMIMKFILRGRKQKWAAESSRVSLEDKGVFEGGGMLHTILLEAGDQRSGHVTWARAASWT